MDFDNDGFLTRLEIKVILKRNMKNMDEDLIDDLLDELDQKGTGMINIEEYVEVMLQANALHQPSRP